MQAAMNDVMGSTSHSSVPSFASANASAPAMTRFNPYGGLTTSFGRSFEPNAVQMHYEGEVPSGTFDPFGTAGSAPLPFIPPDTLDPDHGVGANNADQNSSLQATSATQKRSRSSSHIPDDESVGRRKFMAVQRAAGLQPAVQRFNVTRNEMGNPVVNHVTAPLQHPFTIGADQNEEMLDREYAKRLKAQIYARFPDI